MKKKPSNVDDYIKKTPKELQNQLKTLRAIIKKVAPHAEEKISYGMPYYEYIGRLVYFAAAKKHIGFYILPPIIEEHKNELKSYETTKATIRFPIDKPLPITLIKKLIKARMKRNSLKK